jgi:CRISPR-associated endonuclease/helicase Cas3
MSDSRGACLPTDTPLEQDELARFRKNFGVLQLNPPLPWQERLFQDFCRGELPSALDLPTGLGKTSVMAIWYLALKAGAPVPRRLVYVVDRRAVVDQATTVAEKIREGSGDSVLRISTLRGKYTDNREWLADPTAPAIVVGTIDMIGSRLLFSGYGVSWKMRPYHAGLLGADALVVLDEAHLCPPFEALLKGIARAPDSAFGPRSEEEWKIVPRFRMMSLSATGRGDNQADGGKIFRLGSADYKDEVITKRLAATKSLKLSEVEDGKALVKILAERAWALGTEPRPSRVLVYCNSRDDAVKVKEELEGRLGKHGYKDGKSSELLVGARRVHEREALFEWLETHGFVGEPNSEPAAPTFLVATSAGEVGVDLDADHMVCDLVEWERMVQRLGRVNRRGRKQACVEVIAAPPKEPKKNAEKWDDRLARLRAPLDCLPALAEGGRDASPGAIAALKSDKGLKDLLQRAQTPAPLWPALTRPLVDAWSMTSLDQHAGRPDIEPWLRGWKKDEGPQTHVVWRTHVPARTRGVASTKREINDFFEAAPPHTSEILETETWQAVEWLSKRAKRLLKSEGRLDEAKSIESSRYAARNAALSQQRENMVVYVLSAAGELRSLLGSAELARDGKEIRQNLSKEFAGGVLVVDARFGGLSNGLLDSESDETPLTMDHGGKWEPIPPFQVRRTTERGRATDKDWRECYRFVAEQPEEGEEIRWIVVEQRRDQAQTEDGRAITRKAQRLDEHQGCAKEIADELARALKLPDAYRNALAVAARLHDEGKSASRWQRAFSAPNDAIYAKTTGPASFRLLDGYRHEFGSLPFAEKDADFKALSADLQDLALHLIAAHHGGARPVISTQGCEDAPPSALAGRAREVALRFARLQKRWGPWGLAWWEAVLRAADQQASRNNDAGDDETSENAKIEEKV